MVNNVGYEKMKVLKGVKVNDFAYPEAVDAYEALNRAPLIKPALTWLCAKSNQGVLRNSVLGNCFEVSETELPDLFKILKETCSVLDYGPVPRLFTYHNSSYDFTIFVGEPSIVVIPDFSLLCMDESMLRFQMGRSITALKADSSQLSMLVTALSVASFSINIPGFGNAVWALIADWARKEQYSEDRGGLLACQDINAAERTLMTFAGMPAKYQEPDCLTEYIRTYQENPMLATTFQYLRTINRTESWKNDRILSLYQWYLSGEYDDILEKYG